MFFSPYFKYKIDANKPIKADVEPAQQTADALASTTITLQSDESHDKNQSQNNDDNKHAIVHVDDDAATATNSQASGPTSVVAPLATTEDDDDKDDATINKWSELRVKALKFNENKYFGYIVKAIITIASASLVNRNRYLDNLWIVICSGFFFFFWRRERGEVIIGGKWEA